MLQKSNAIVLRSVKYGETSLVVTVFTAVWGVETYMVKGVRTISRRSRAGSFHPAALLEIVAGRQAGKSMQYLRDYTPAYIYQTIQEHVVKNSIVLFSAELLLRILPAGAPLPALFDFVFDYFITLDKRAVHEAGNFPLYFIIQCSKILGYELTGSYSPVTPYLDLEEGGFAAEPPAAGNALTAADAEALSNLLMATDYDALLVTELNGAARLRLTDWYIAFLQRHTGHMGHIRSLAVLRMILH